MTITLPAWTFFLLLSVVAVCISAATDDWDAWMGGLRTMLLVVVLLALWGGYILGRAFS